MIDLNDAHELMSSFEEHYESMQVSLNKLLHSHCEGEFVNSAFRAIHSIKGNASMLQLEPLVVFSHALEEVVESLRSKRFEATSILCDLLLTGSDRLRDLHNKYLFDKNITSINEAQYVDAFISISQATDNEAFDLACKHAMNLFYPNQAEKAGASHSSEADDTVTKPIIELYRAGAHEAYLDITDAESKQLQFFRTLSLQVDEQNPFWELRTDTLCYLAIKTSSLSDRSLDLKQLVAAVYLHDIGMAFLRNDIVNKANRLSALEINTLQQHPVWAFEIARRMKGWEPAADMVHQHQERVDGNGYPCGISGKDICDGAKLLAIIDAFFAMTNLRGDRSHRRSMLRAISEVNACVDTQFDAYWVGLFNEVIRQESKLHAFGYSDWKSLGSKN